MTVERIEDQAPGLQPAPPNKWPEPSSSLQQFAIDAKVAFPVALSLANTPFVPTSYKQRGSKQNRRWLEAQEIAQNVTAAWLAGEEIGLSPMQALKSIDIIEGTPALNALAQRALVQAHGHEVWVHERISDARGQRTQVSVTVRGRRAGSDHVAESTWSLDRARQAGLLSKDNWQNHPEAMCYARASSDVCRQIAADVLMGLAYTVEELEDEDSIPAGAGEHAVAVRPKKQSPEEQAEEQPLEPEKDSAGVGEGEAPAPAEQQPEEEPRAAEPEPEQEALCDQRKDGEPTKVCSRPAGHAGRHHYGREVAADKVLPTEQEPAPIKDPEKTEPALRPDLEDPEARAQCPAEHPSLGRCSLPAGHEGEHKAGNDSVIDEESRVDEAAQGEPEIIDGEVEEDEYKQPTDEELAAAYEAEQAAAAERAAQAEREAGERAPVAPAEPEPQEAELPVEDPPIEAAAGSDDPWADFK